MTQTIRDWLQQPIVLADALPYALMAAAFLLLLIGLARANHRSRHAAQTGASPKPRDILTRLLSAMSLTPGEDTLLRLVALAFLILFALALAATFVLVGSILVSVFDTNAEARPSASFGLGALLVALLGAPFLVWRTLVAQRTLEATQRQTTLQDEALFNDKINAATSDLAARRQSSRVGTSNEEAELILTEWQDDGIKRAVAIDRLESLARERRQMTSRVARILSTYVRELSHEHPAKRPPENASLSSWREWGDELCLSKRRDIEAATRALGRLQPKADGVDIGFDPQSIDLRFCNLQGLDLSGLNFRGARLEEAQLQASTLSFSKFRGAALSGCGLQVSRLISVELEDTALYGADFQAANLQNVDFRKAEIAWANFGFAYLRRPKFDEYTSLSRGNLSFKNAAFQGLEPNQTLSIAEHWDQVFADGSVELPSGETRPDHWPKSVFNDFHAFKVAWSHWLELRLH